MIRINQQPEPNNFNSKVRQPGQDFLQRYPTPRGRDWKPYWRKISKNLYQSYFGICAYTGMWFARIGNISVDHFRPKSIYPHLAYEWTNYRLTTQKTNYYKADDDNIVDPFMVQAEWFILDFPSCLIKPGNNVTQSERSQIENTINVLKLNGEEFVELRDNIIQNYIDGIMAFNNMNEKYPFIAYELERQNLTDIAILQKLQTTFTT
jgi:uncharacterized protein (TIGR02646 family)